MPFGVENANNELSRRPANSVIRPDTVQEVAAMRETIASLRGPALLGLGAVAVTAAWISLLFFVIGPLSRG
jgi:hypothetical protein